jgi:uncharacterized protein YcfL|tara:strand:- start:128 stop:295 length:168 start_codon:yes stop_codon:yes gene_type:complete
MKKLMYLMVMSLVTIGLVSCDSSPDGETTNEETVVSDTTAVEVIETSTPTDTIVD